MNDWLKWINALQSIAQTGLHYSNNPFDIERYETIREIAVMMMEKSTDIPRDKIMEIFSLDMGYATPKVDVRGVVFQNDQILLVKERSDGLWTLPGGYADINESPSEAVVREVQEESGYSTTAVKLLALYDKLKHDHPPQLPHVYKIFFLCQLTGGEPTPNIEISEIGFFPEGALPGLSRHRVTESQIQRLFEHHRHPEWVTDFD